MAALSGCRPAYQTLCAGIFGVAVAPIACRVHQLVRLSSLFGISTKSPSSQSEQPGAALAAVLESPDVVGWSGAPGDTVRPAVGFFSRWASPEAPRRPHRTTGLRAARHTASTSDGASLQDGRPGFKNVYHADCEADRIESRKLLLAAMKHDSWTVSKFRAWKKEQSQPPMAPSGPDKTPSSLLAAVDPAVDPAAVGKYKRSRYNDRKFLQKPKTGGDVGTDDFGSAIFGSRVSLRTLAPVDAVSIHANTAPLRLPVAFPTRSTAFGSYGRYQEPLSQWQIAADMYIDSDIRKRARRRLVGRACEARTPLPPVERVERRPAEPCPRRQEVDLELGIPRRRLVLQGPLYSSSYAHWYSRVFSPLSPSTGEP